MLKYFIAVLMTVSAIGCAVNQPTDTLYTPAYTGVKGLDSLPTLISWCKDLTGPSQELWLQSARKRFVNPVIFSCHGGYEYKYKMVDGERIEYREWYLYPDEPREKMPADSAAKTLANLYPDRDVVFMACNEYGHTLTVRRVFYARQKVWIVPDEYQSPFKFLQHETLRDWDSVGSIWEFVAYDGGGKKLDVIPIWKPEIPTTKPATVPATQPTTAPTTVPSSKPTTKQTSQVERVFPYYDR